MHHEAKFLCPPTELIQAAFCLVDRLDPFLGVAISAPERVFERFEPWVELKDACSCQLG